MLQFLLTLTDESNRTKVEDLYNTYHDFMIKYSVRKFSSKRRSNPVLDAEDAVQNAFVKIVKYIDNIDFSREARDIKNYIFTMLNNEIANILDDNVEFLEFNEEICHENEYNFIGKIDVKERYDEVLNAIRVLDEKYSSTLYLILHNEMTVNEVAEMMGIPAKTVYTRFARGKQLLLDSLKGEKINGK